MQIEYNKQQETLIIKDGLKLQYLLIKIMMAVLLVNSIIIVVTALKTGFGTLDYLWILFGLIALYSLYNLIIKKSTVSEIPIKEIEHLKIRNLRSKTHFSLLLKNGKVRNLAVFSDDKEEQRLIQLFNKARVPKV
jgi:hypothetical protein